MLSSVAVTRARAASLSASRRSRSSSRAAGAHLRVVSNTVTSTPPTPPPSSGTGLKASVKYASSSWPCRWITRRWSVKVNDSPRRVTPSYSGALKSHTSGQHSRVGWPSPAGCLAPSTSRNASL